MKNIKLITLSIVKGQINLIATIPQRSTVIHLGAFLSNRVCEEISVNSDLL